MLIQMVLAQPIFRTGGSPPPNITYINPATQKQSEEYIIVFLFQKFTRRVSRNAQISSFLVGKLFPRVSKRKCESCFFMSQKKTLKTLRLRERSFLMIKWKNLRTSNSEILT